jgi:hypothetical protein
MIDYEEKYHQLRNIVKAYTSTFTLLDAGKLKPGKESFDLLQDSFAKMKELAEEK